MKKPVKVRYTKTGSEMPGRAGPGHQVHNDLGSRV